MKKTLSLISASLSICSVVPALASIVLAPGESKVVGSETVVCSVGSAPSTATFSRAYYDCVYNKPSAGAPNGASNQSFLTVTYVSEDGAVSSLGLEQTQLADDYDACKSELDTLNSNRLTITKYTEIELCYQYSPTSSPVLRTYVFATNGRIIPVRSVDMPTIPLCVKEANEFNSKLP